MSRKNACWFIGLAVGILSVLPALGATYYVDVNYDGSQGAGTGVSDKPFTNLTEACVAANTNDGNIILVADGVYASTAAGGYENFGEGGFRLTRTITIQGGYTGQVTGATFNWDNTNRTIGSTIINLQSANTRAFLLGATGKIQTLDGLAIINANHTRPGGALMHTNAITSSAAFSLVDCLFSNNVTTADGGALWAYSHGGSTLSGCRFAGNRGANGGAAILTSGTAASFTITNCLFAANEATGSGGAIYSAVSTWLIAGSSTFASNIAATAGGAVAVASGTHRFNNSVFLTNQASLAMSPASGGAVGSVSFSTASAGGASLTLEQCLIAGNGGVYAISHKSTSATYPVTVRQCTIAHNRGGGLYAHSQTYSGTLRTEQLSLYNTIVADNGDTGVWSRDTTPDWDFNLVTGHAVNDYDNITPGAHDASGSAAFADPGSFDFRLSSSSTAIDAGTQLVFVVDLDGTPRPTRNGVDIGCYEERQMPTWFAARPARLANAAWLPGRIGYTGQSDTVYFVGWRAGADGGTDKSQWTWAPGSVTGAIVMTQASPLAAETLYTFRILVSNNYDEAFSSPFAFTSLTVGAGAERVWSDGMGTGSAAEEGNWVPAGLPASSDTVIFSGSLPGGMTWPAGVGDTVAGWVQEVDFNQVCTLGTTAANYSDVFTNLTVTGDAVILGGDLTCLTNLYPYGVSSGNPASNFTHRLALTVRGNLTVGSAGRIHAYNRGYREGTPGNNGGGSHGGLGGGTTYSAYGSYRTPLLPGMGSLSTAGPNQPGGGAIWIDVQGTALIDGLIEASGVYIGGNYCRAAAGGSVYLRAGSLSGTGAIRARGMTSGGGSNTGNGGGGRAAVVLTNDGAIFSTHWSTNIDAAAGMGGSSSAFGSGGSVYLVDGSGRSTYVVDFLNRYGDLVDDKIHTFTAESMTDCDLVLRNQALAGFLLTGQTKQVKDMTADASSHVKFSFANNRLICNTLVYDGVSKGKGLYTSTNFPALVSGPGAIEVLFGRPSGTIMMVK